ncbi:MAG: LacI family DNA-binding transcriptional regulator [Betaproteobacteria bacterium]
MARDEEPKGPAKARLDEVARLARVSPITVSRALRNPALVAEATRKRILRVVGKTGYVPDRAASTLASNSSRIVALIIPRATNPSNAEIFQGLADRLESEGFSLLLGTTRSDIRKEEALIEAVLGWRPAALVVTGMDHTARARKLLARARVPIVELFDTARPPLDMAVGFSNSDASAALAERLWNKGYRSIHYVHVDFPQNSRLVRRRDGFLAAMRGLGVESPVVHDATDVTFSAGVGAAKTILSGGRRPDAVMCTNDVIAVGAMYEFIRRGLKVPRDIAVAGFEDIDLASAVSPTLTSVSIDAYQIGRIAGDNILLRLAGKDVPRVVDVGFRIVKRESA